MFGACAVNRDPGKIPVIAQITALTTYERSSILKASLLLTRLDSTGQVLGHFDELTGQRVAGLRRSEGVGWRTRRQSADASQINLAAYRSRILAIIPLSS